MGPIPWLLTLKSVLGALQLLDLVLDLDLWSWHNDRDLSSSNHSARVGGRRKELHPPLRLMAGCTGGGRKRFLLLPPPRPPPPPITFDSAGQPMDSWVKSDRRQRELGQRDRMSPLLIPPLARPPLLPSAVLVKQLVGSCSR